MTTHMGLDGGQDGDFICLPDPSTCTTTTQDPFPLSILTKIIYLPRKTKRRTLFRQLVRAKELPEWYRHISMQYTCANLPSQIDISLPPKDQYVRDQDYCFRANLSGPAEATSTPHSTLTGQTSCGKHAMDETGAPFPSSV